ncbi:MAG: hypothetical protein WD534_10385 [Phycisphaeraceae bacterium]
MDARVIWFVGCAVLLLTVGVTAAKADQDPSLRDYQRAQSLLRQLTDETQALRQRCLERYVPVVEPHGNKTPEQQVLEKIDADLKKLTEGTANLEQWRRRYEQREVSLEDFVRRTSDLQLTAIAAAWDAVILEAGWAVWLIQHNHDTEVRRLRAEHRRDAEVLKAQHPERGEALAAAMQRLTATYLAQENQAIEAQLQAHREVTEALVARRRAMCGMQWKLADYLSMYGRTQQARKAEAAVYAQFAYDLTGRGVAFHNRLLGGWSAQSSRLDYFVNFPGSEDRLILTTLWNKEIPALHKMNAAFAAEPVEMLRVAEENLPAINVPGSVVEQMCRILSIRLQHYYRLENEQLALQRNLERDCDRLEQLKAMAGLETLGPQIKALAERHARVERAQAEGRQRRQELENVLAQRRQALANTERALRDEPQQVYVNRRSLERVEGDGREHVLASRKLNEVMEALVANQQLLDDPDLDPRQRVAMLENLMPRLNRERDKLEQVLADAQAPLRKARDTAQQAVEAAQQAVAGIEPVADDTELAADWAAARQAYQQLAEQARTGRRTSLPPLPDTLPSAEVANRAAEAMAKLNEQLAGERVVLRNQVLNAMGRMVANDQTMHRLAQSIVNLRASGSVTAQHALEQLGAKADDPVMVQLRQLNSDLGEVKTMVDTFDGRMERMDQALQFLTDDQAGRAIIGKVRDRLEVVKKTLGAVGDYGGQAMQVQAIIDLMEDDRTALDALGQALKLTSALGQKTPVIGQTIGQFLAFYADAAVAAGGAARSIQASLIEEDLRLHFTDPPPERHLYTESELAELRIGNEAARERVLKMLQTRRLIALTGAQSLRLAIDEKR